MDAIYPSNVHLQIVIYTGMTRTSIPLMFKVCALYYSVQTHCKGVTVHVQKHFLFKPNFQPASPEYATTAQFIFTFALTESMFWILEKAICMALKTLRFTPKSTLIHSDATDLSFEVSQ